MQSDRVLYWLEMCEYDLDVSKSLLASKHYLYVGFMCHQVVEKALKAYLCSLSDEQPPYTHSLKRLLSLTYLAVDDKQLDFLSFVDPLNIKARYSAYKDDIAMRLTPEICEKLLRETEEFLLWIQSKL